MGQVGNKRSRSGIVGSSMWPTVERANSFMPSYPTSGRNRCAINPTPAGGARCGRPALGHKFSLGVALTNHPNTDRGTPANEGICRPTPHHPWDVAWRGAQYALALAPNNWRLAHYGRSDHSLLANRSQDAALLRQVAGSQIAAPRSSDVDTSAGSRGLRHVFVGLARV